MFWRELPIDGIEALSKDSFGEAGHAATQRSRLLEESYAGLTSTDFF
jgi:hypothetical protein